MAARLSLPETARTAPPEGWTERLDRRLIRLLYRKEALLLEGGGDATAQARRLQGRLEAQLAVRRHLLRTRGPASSYAPERLVLLITRACQLRCSYCHMDKFDASLSEADLCRGVDLLLTSRRPALQLQFFGGDPLLRFDLIESAVRRAEAHRGPRTLRYMLTTNGQALDARKIEFFRRHDFLVEFSFDGDRDTFAAQRPGLGGRDFYAKIQANLAALRNSGVRYYCIAVATPETVARLFENFRFLVGLGHRRIQINYQLGRRWTPEATRELLLQMRRVAHLAARTPRLEFINATSERREPTVLNSELVLDTDGSLYRETGIFLEAELREFKQEFFVARIEAARGLDAYAASPFDNFYLLSEVYAKARPDLRATVLSNLRVGYALERCINRIRARRPA